ncbi:MarR family winged helix-turn-helix transcriptional regulator [Methanobrevibacter sp.]|uniref:MarR family winged helix-turn-helix transcriptional regulator n=1 Tax=Methanobrevibacter sp. TaxID=66852 RepID=UPI003890A38F
MLYCDLEEIDSKDLPISKLVALIYKSQKIFFNNMLSELNINNTQFHILFEIRNDSNINQEKIASRCNVNKGVVARSIKKLEDNDFISRAVDENNRRQNIISLTQKGKETINQATNLLNDLEDYLFDDNDEKELLQNILKDLAIKAISLNEKGFDKIE